MDQQFDFRALLLKLQDCLSDNDRRRLHFIVGDTIPRQLRDDPTLGGTLSLLESLFDRAKISEQDFDYLIHAFRQIHCYEGVKRLEEYQMIKNGRIRSNTTVSQLPEVDEVDRINIIHDFSSLTNITAAEQQKSGSTQSTSISTNKESNNITSQLPARQTSIKSEKKIGNINLTIIKQTLKSRLTTCQLILLFLNIFGIITFILVIVLLRKQSCTKDLHPESVLIFKEGHHIGDTNGGKYFDDSDDNSLTLKDTLVGVNATWSFDTLNTVTFIYSNDRTSKHGTGDGTRPELYSNGFYLVSNESITGVTVFRGLRDIENPYKPNGTIILVGLRFTIDNYRTTELFGSSNGTRYDETHAGYTLAYVKGRAQGFIDALQFIWSKTHTQNAIARMAQI